MESDLILLTDWTWAALEDLELLRRCAGKPLRAWVFRSPAAADRARRSYGRGRWRSMEIVRV